MNAPCTRRPRRARRARCCCASDNDGIALLTLNRPEARNSLSEAHARRAVRDASPRSPPTRRVRAVVLAANGPAFCAGHDLKELTARRSDPDGGRAYFTAASWTTCSAMMQQIVRPAAAGDRRGARRRHRRRLPAGRELRSRGRLRRPRKFATPGVEYRPVLLDADGGAVAQCRAQARDGNAAHRRHGLGRGRARASGSSIAWSRPAPSARRRLQLARKIAAKSAHDRQDRQGSVLPPARDGPRRRLSLTPAEVMVENMMARDAEEGIGAFIEKRDPKWEDR